MTRPLSPTETQIEHLGQARAMIVDCLGGNGRFTPVRFAPEAQSDVQPLDQPGPRHLAAYRAYIQSLAQLTPPATQPITQLLLAAGRLLLGELGQAGQIIDSFPSEPYRLDHGAGYCNTAHLAALRAALPLPGNLQQPAQWTAGSPEQSAIRAWLATHHARLRWLEPQGAYLVDG